MTSASAKNGPVPKWTFFDAGMAHGYARLSKATVAPVTLVRLMMERPFITRKLRRRYCSQSPRTSM
eukprot:6194112-Pleurochrysis_carterae.AAC.1